VKDRGDPAPAYSEVAPPPALRPFVEHLWVHRIEDPPPPEGRRLLPDGRVNLVWVGGLGVQISGPQTHYTRPPDVPRMLVFGATFRPGAAPHLLRTPASELVNHHVALDAVDARLAARIDARLQDAADPRQALAAFADELERSLPGTHGPDPAVNDAVRLLDHPAATIAEVATRTFVSERELQRRFAEHIGYGPKTLQRVLRFQRFMQHIAVPRAELAGAAARAGYTDQSHLTRETRRLAGLTPSRLRHWKH
jgi:AraC-like DNA-binding protein